LCVFRRGKRGTGERGARGTPGEFLPYIAKRKPPGNRSKAPEREPGEECKGGENRGQTEPRRGERNRRKETPKEEGQAPGKPLPENTREIFDTIKFDQI
jgi:hypothetical protein